MICRNCLTRIRLARASPVHNFTQLAYSASTLSAPRGPPSGTHEGPPVATSTSAAQPFSTPLSPTPGAAPLPSSNAERVKSSVPAGTPLKGLGYLKNKDPPIALEDHEYPHWLWVLLDRGKKDSEKTSETEGNAYSKSKKQRRAAARAAAKAAKADPSSRMPKVPLEQQSIDLPGGDGSLESSVEASQARSQLTEAMRRARRKSIKEGNFLKGMR